MFKKSFILLSTFTIFSSTNCQEQWNPATEQEEINNYIEEQRNIDTKKLELNRLELETNARYRISKKLDECNSTECALQYLFKNTKKLAEKRLDTRWVGLLEMARRGHAIESDEMIIKSNLDLIDLIQNQTDLVKLTNQYYSTIDFNNKFSPEIKQSHYNALFIKNFGRFLKVKELIEKEDQAKTAQENN